MSYHRNVFINCPFDDEYYPLLKALLFTTIFCRLDPKISETKDGGDVRVQQIQDLIEGSKYSIHDLSRILPKEKGDLPRFNMPYELGLDLGCRRFMLDDKKCLILEEEKYRYKIVISDISGQDISAHENDPRQLVKEVRDWLYIVKGGRKPLAYTIIWDLYNEFLFDLDTDMRAEQMDPDQMWEIPFSELITFMKDWIKNKLRK